MKKVILGTFLGLILSVGGFGLVFFSLTVTLSSILNIILMVMGIVFVGVGVFLLYKAGTMDVNKPHFEDLNVPNGEQSASILAKNNELVNQFNKTMRARDKLKILKMSASADEQKM